MIFFLSHQCTLIRKFRFYRLLVKIDFLARKFKYASVGVIPQFIEALSAVLTFTFYTKVSFVVDNYIVALKAHNFLKDTFYFFASRVPAAGTVLLALNILCLLEFSGFFNRILLFSHSRNAFWSCEFSLNEIIKFTFNEKPLWFNIGVFRFI